MQVGIVQNIEASLQTVVAMALGYDLKDPETPAKVRIGWQTEGQPAFAITDDVVFLRATPEDDEQVDRQVDVNFSTPDGEGNITRTTTYMQCWRVLFTVYGPSCIDNAFRIRRALVAAEIHDQLAIALTKAGIFLVPDVAPPQRVPEQLDGQWWERADMSAKFNVLATDASQDLAVGSVTVTITKENGLTDTVTANTQ